MGIILLPFWGNGSGVDTDGEIAGLVGGIIGEIGETGETKGSVEIEGVTGDDVSIGVVGVGSVEIWPASGEGSSIIVAVKIGVDSDSRGIMGSDAVIERGGVEDEVWSVSTGLFGNSIYQYYFTWTR